MDAASSLARHFGVFPGLASEGEEHALAMLKPDFDATYFDEFLELCAKSGLTVVEDGGHVQLSRQEHDNLFLDRAENYRSYMTSGPVRPFLVKGSYAAQRLSAIKSAIRIKRGLHVSSLCNMIHTADDGREFQHQAQFFFPDIRLQSYADLALEWEPGQTDLDACLSRRSVSCRWIGLLINYEDLEQFRDCFREIDLGEHRCLPAIRLVEPTGTVSVFPSPFNFDVFFDTPPKADLSRQIASNYGICALEPSKTSFLNAEEVRELHFLDIARHLEERAEKLEKEMVRLAPNDRKGIMAMRTLAPDDTPTSTDIARRCAARLGWRTWGGSGNLTTNNWRTLSRGAFERLIFSMPEL